MSFSNDLFTLREVLTTKNVRESRHVCTVCYPMAGDMKLSSDELSAAMRTKVLSDPAKFASSRSDPPGTFQNVGPSTPRLAHLKDVHGMTPGSVSPRSDGEAGPQSEVRIPGLTEVEQAYVWMFVDCGTAPHVLRKKSLRHCDKGTHVR